MREHICLTPIRWAMSGAQTNRMSQAVGAIGQFRQQWGLLFTTRDISGTADPRLYQTARYWAFQTGGYRFDVTPGTYQVDLRFAEQQPVNQPGFRYQWMSTSMERSSLCMMDIVSAAGCVDAV